MRGLRRAGLAGHRRAQDSNTIARAAIPFFFCLVACIVIVTVAPVIVTWLPDAVMGAQR